MQSWFVRNIRLAPNVQGSTEQIFLCAHKWSPYIKILLFRYATSSVKLNNNKDVGVNIE